jgi:signal transduction histidine kinase
VSTNPRIAILPREASSVAVTTAIARGAWAVAIVFVVLDIPVLVDVLNARGIMSALPLPLAALVTMTILLAIAGLRPNTVTRIVFIVGGAAVTIVFIVALLAADPTLNGDAAYLLNRPAIALVLLAPVTMRPVSGLVWSTIGLASATATFFVATLIAGQPFMPGWGLFTAWAAYSAAFLIITIVRATQVAAVPDLSRLEEETRRMALENQFEERAAALIHDTVLGDLTAVMNSPAQLDDRARDRFRSDVSTLKDLSWLRETDTAFAIDERDATLRNGTIALVSEMQWRGLTVDLTGNNDSVVRLGDDVTAAVHAAMRACLENVLAHSGTQSAELVAGGDETELTYMVIDHGVGFDPSAVPHDRLGLRNSVVGRIEALGGSVRVWSQPGSGTSVLISVPQVGAS